MADLHTAIEWAVRAHEGQWRDGEYPLPYVTHPLEVLSILRSIGEVTEPELLVAAVLHDVVEGGAIEIPAIEATFGLRVSQWVAELTRREPGPDETAGMSERQIYELRNQILLAEIAAMSPEAQTIKLADRISNLREAERVRKGGSRARYRLQTEQILAIIPKRVNRHLWIALHKML